MEKKGKGRRKVEIKKIDNVDARQVSFSKCRSGLFKKASELSTLCGAELAIMVYSRAGRPFTFSQPGVDPFSDRFLGSSSGPGPGVNPNPNLNLVELQRNANIHNLNRQCMELTELLEAQKKRKEALAEWVRVLSCGPIGALAHGREGLQRLGWEELEQLAKELEDLRMKVAARVRETTRGATGPLGAPSSVNLIQMVSPNGNEATKKPPALLMGGGGPSFK